MAAPLYAQSVSPVTVTPPSLIPERRDNGMRVDIPEAGALQAPAGAEGMGVTLGDARLEGGFVEVSGATDAVLQTLRGRRVSLAQIYAAASEIEAIHARAGYVLARVSVPPQDLADGAGLRIVITDGFVEAIDVTGLPARVQAPMKARTAKLIGQHHIRLAQIEQALLIAGDTPGVALRSTLMRGRQPGGTKIVLEGSQHLVQGSIGVDDNLDPTLGRWGVNAQLALNSALGLGEQIYGFVSTDYDAGGFTSSAPRERVLGGGVILPLGDGRISVNPEATSAVTTPTPAAGTPLTVGSLRRLTLRINDTLLRSRFRQLGLNLAIEQIDESNKVPAFANEISHDRYMAVRPGVVWSAAQADGSNYAASLQFSKGLGSLGAITAADAGASGVPFSRQGSGTRFDKLTITGHVNLELGTGFTAAFNLRAQSSFGKALFRAEQFSLEGADGLSAYVGGRTAVDEGIVARAEMGKNIATPGGPKAMLSALTPYVFGALGTGKLEQPTTLEYSTISAFNAGAGLRAILCQRISLSAEYARGISDYPTLDHTGRVNVSATLRF